MRPGLVEFYPAVSSDIPVPLPIRCRSLLACHAARNLNKAKTLMRAIDFYTMTGIAISLLSNFREFHKNASDGKGTYKVGGSP